MAVIKSGASTDQLSIDPTSKAARVTIYDSSGNLIVFPADHTTAVSPESVRLTDGTSFYKATTPADTQPVSGTIGVSNFPVLQATDDVSSGPTGSAVSSEAMYVGGNKGGVLTGITLDPNNNVNVNISDVAGNAATAKGIQPNAAIPTQDFKDSGRTYVILYVDRTTGSITEALVTMSINKGGVLTTGTSYTVSAGKIFRIQSVNAEILNTTTVVNRVLIRVRSAASVLVTSPIVAMALASSQAALATAGDTDPHSFPDGLEIAAGQQVGISQLANVATAGIVSAIIVGYEY